MRITPKMPQQDLRKCGAYCEVIMERPYQMLRIDYNSECCRVTTQDAFIKAETFSAKGNHKFRVKIEIESIPDDEVSNAYEVIQFPQRKSQTEFGDNESDAQDVQKMPYTIEEIFKAAKA